MKLIALMSQRLAGVGRYRREQARVIEDLQQQDTGLAQARNLKESERRKLEREGGDPIRLSALRDEIQQIDLKREELQSSIDAAVQNQRWASQLRTVYLDAISLESDSPHVDVEALFLRETPTTKTKLVKQVVKQKSAQGQGLKPADIHLELSSEYGINISMEHLYNILSRLVTKEEIARDKEGGYYVPRPDQKVNETEEKRVN